TVAFGSSQHSLPSGILIPGTVSIFGQTFDKSWILSAGVSLVVIVAIFGYLYYTRLGYATRAIMSNRNEAAGVGINVNRVSAINFGIGIALAVIPGYFYSFVGGSIAPDVGTNITVIAFVVIVIGSLGKPLGVIVGGIVYGVAISVMQLFLPSWTNFMPNALLILIMLFKPEGLLSRGGPQRV